MSVPGSTDSVDHRLRNLRRDLGLSQEQLARRLGVSFVTVNRWESGRSPVSARAAAALAQLEASIAVAETGDTSTALPVARSSFVGRERELATGEFAWMTDSIQMTAGLAGMSAYLAKAGAGTVAFASRQPGAILSVEVAPGREYMVHRRAFLAGTAGIEIGPGFRQPSATPGGADGEFLLRRIGGAGRAWVELPGDVVRHDLRAGVSLRTRPGHIGMSDASVVIQIVQPEEPAAGDARQFAVLSGPGSVWLQSMPLPTAPCPSFRPAAIEETQQYGALRTPRPPAGQRDHRPGRRRP